MITIQEYEEREQKAADELPNRVVEMVNPVVFASEGYPMRVHRDRALWRYMDVMHETRFEMDIAGLFEGGLTLREYDWLKRVATLARDFSRSLFGKPFTARGSLLRALHVFRSIFDIVAGRTMRVLEIGPGSGYLGCLFQQSGWGYVASDITQAFYLFQNRLWNYSSGGRLVELAEEIEWDGLILENSAVHLPWWKFFRLLDGKIPSVDIVTCNHALAEMHPNGLAFTMRIAQEMLKGEGLKLFIFEGWGFEKLNARDKVLEQFVRFGFNLVHTDDKISVFAPQPTLADPRTGILPNGKILSHVQTVDKAIYLPHNIISPRILLGRAQRRKEKLIGLAEINEFYRELLGKDDLRTADEQFLDSIGKNYH